ncbi:membrane hypothetical protein [Candidatus Xenohaliotis californiensis]|uniref:Uncharacterized protein n=1 Tax=Candidatus Xenohaliotis californiensis TaxID=84677 RepID=A0ABP0ETW1_9RICK|nr:membrane hypothetical protein [Candidatus Xenohaliotis californiensis]
MPSIQSQIIENLKIRPKNAYANKIVLCPVGHQDDISKIKPHYFIDKNNRIYNITPINTVSPSLSGATWGEDSDLESSCILVGIEQTSSLLDEENNTVEDSDSLAETNSVSDLRFLKNIKQYTLKKKKLLHTKGNSVSSKTILSLADIHGIQKDNIISDFDLHLPQTSNILPSSIWKEINPSLTIDELDSTPIEDARALSIHETNPRVKELKSYLMCIGYRIDEDTPVLDQQTFDSCMSLSSKFFGIATTTAAYKAGEVSSKIVRLARTLAQKKTKPATTLSSAYPSAMVNTELLESLHKKKSTELSKSIRNSKNVFTLDSLAYATAMTIITILICIILPYIPGLTLFAANIGKIICGLIAGGAITGHFISPHPKANAEVRKSLKDTVSLTEKHNSTFNQLVRRLQNKGVQISSVELSTPKDYTDNKKEDKSLITTYTEELILTLKLLAPSLSILAIAVIMTTFLTIPTIALNTIVAIAMITYALTGAYASYMKSAQLIKDSEPYTQNLIENFKKKNDFIKNVLKTQGIDAEVSRHNNRNKNLDNISKKYKQKKIVVAILAASLLITAITLTVVPSFIPILASGILNTLISKIAITIFVSMGTMFAVKKYSSIGAEKNIEIFQKLAKERKDIVSTATLSSNGSKMDTSALNTADKLQANYKKTRKLQKENMERTNRPSTLLGITLLQLGGIMFIISAFIAFNAPTITIAILNALVVLVAGMLVKYGIKSILAPDSTINNVQLRMNSAYLNHEIAANSLLTTVKNAIKKHKPLHTSVSFEQLEFKRDLILEEIRNIDRKINNLSIEKAAYQTHQNTNKIFAQRLMSPHTIAAALATATFSIIISIIPFLALTPLVSGILTTTAVVLMAVASGAFGDSLFKYYPPKYVAARTIDIINLNEQKEALAIQLTDALEEYKTEASVALDTPTLSMLSSDKEVELDKDMHYTQEKSTFSSALTNASLVPLMREQGLANVY